MFFLKTKNIFPMWNYSVKEKTKNSKQSNKQINKNKHSNQPTKQPINLQTLLRKTNSLLQAALVWLWSICGIPNNWKSSYDRL